MKYVAILNDEDRMIVKAINTVYNNCAKRTDCVGCVLYDNISEECFFAQGNTLVDVHEYLNESITED